MPLAPFIVLSLPRSRSAWLAHWLNKTDGGPAIVGYDTSIESDSVEDFLEPLASGRIIGTVETGAVEAWRLLVARLPGLHLLTVRRPLEEVDRSLQAFGIHAREELLLRDALLDEVEALGGAQRIEYSNLEYIPTRAWIWQFLRGEVLPVEWDAQLAVLNIQVDMQARVAQLVRRASATEALRAECLRQIKELPQCDRLH